MSRQLADFEDFRWSIRGRKLCWEHMAALELVQEEPVLDLGGGDGLLLSLLRDRGFSNMKLIDVSPVAVRKACERGFEAEVGDITEPLPFEDKSFGTVCAVAVLEHLYNPLNLLKEMGRIGSSVVVVVPNCNYWKERMKVLLGKRPLQYKPERGHVYWFNYYIMEEMARAAGLRIDSILFGGFLRLGPVGGWLAKFHPNLFSDLIAARLKS